MCAATAGTIFDPARVCVCQSYTRFFFFYRPTVEWAVSLLSNGTHIRRLFSFSSGWLAASVCKNYTRISFLSFISFLYEENFRLTLFTRARRTILFLFVYFSSLEKSKQIPIALKSSEWCHSCSTNHEFGYIAYDIGHCGWHCRNIIPQLLYLLW